MHPKVILKTLWMLSIQTAIKFSPFRAFFTCMHLWCGRWALFKSRKMCLSSVYHCAKKPAFGLRPDVEFVLVFFLSVPHHLHVAFHLIRVLLSLWISFPDQQRNTAIQQWFQIHFQRQWTVEGASRTCLLRVPVHLYHLHQHSLLNKLVLLMLGG